MKFISKMYILLIVLCYGIAGSAACLYATPDLLDELCISIGTTKDELGIHPKQYWDGYPYPDGLPHVLPFVPDLMDDPLMIYDFIKVMGNAVASTLNWDHVEKRNNTLHRLTYLLGVNRKMDGFRCSQLGLNPQVSDDDPLSHAMDALFRSCQNEAFHRLGFREHQNPLQRNLQEKAHALPHELQIIIAELILNISDAYHWNRLAIRRLDRATMERIFEYHRGMDSLIKNNHYQYEYDDIALGIDEISLYYSAMKIMQASETAATEIKQYLSQLEDPEIIQSLASLEFIYPTPIGMMYICGTQNDVHHRADAMLLIDLGGDDTYYGIVGSSQGVDQPFGILIDMAGDDQYIHGTLELDNRTNYGPTQGSGILGTGVLLDVAGDDSYEAIQGAQGLGVFGMGVLFDYQGNDTYRLAELGQGAGMFGIGMALDSLGDDTYYIYGAGQGMGGHGAGIGILANHSGNDFYKAEPDAGVYNLGDYHSGHSINTNQAQGCGSGRRGDLSDGHSWGGGMGGLIDIQGDDRYLSGNWSLGIGYWYGAGFVYDGSGDDHYESNYFTQASGAHFCIGGVVDEGGNDIYTLNQGAGIAYGWDFAVSLHVDKGGDDTYTCNGNGLGVAQINSIALLINQSGDDTYQLKEQAIGLGAVSFSDRERDINSVSPYFNYAMNVGLFVEIGGTDRYYKWDAEHNHLSEYEAWGNNCSWNLLPADSVDYYHHALGYDAEEGFIEDISRYDGM